LPPGRPACQVDHKNLPVLGSRKLEAVSQRGHSLFMVCTGVYYRWWMGDPEGIITEFVADVSEAVKKHWGRLANEMGFVSGHAIIGALEQIQQKILYDMNEELLKAGA
jgi:hypothetical protein